MADLTNAERETMLNMCADDRSTWTVFSDDPVMQRKLESVGAVLTKQQGESKWYSLPANQLSFRQPPKELSADEKARRGELMRSIRSGQ